MAGQLPTPRSYQTIVGDMVDAFLSRLGAQGLKVGGPILSIYETAGQSDLRSSQDIFNLLDATDIDRATGLALDRKAADEDLSRLPATASTGVVTISDTSFTKISSKIYSGAAAPNAGSMSVSVADASGFPSTGSIYLGRSTTNFEGPLAYSSVASAGTYWTITLSSPTQKFHDFNETVVLAQGGNRQIQSGTIVQTAQGNAANAVSYTTVFASSIADGETSVAGISIVCQDLGVLGNVPKGAISAFPSRPFNGASVTNASPLDNAIPEEDDSSLRERIKAARQSRARGTPLALTTNAQGVKAPDENKTVISSVVVQNQGEPATLYIDDGTGYEEITTGIAIETLLDQALGGEQPFRLHGPLPVAKAFVKATIEAPFALEEGALLAVKVGGVLTQHTFDTGEFRAIANATAFEVVSAINGDSALLFSARTSDNGTKVVLFARADTSEDVEVVVPDEGIDANGFLGFPAGINYTLRLYRDDVLLYKDGQSAIVLSAPQSSWANTIATNIFIKVKVDGTPAKVYRITSQDFVDADTGFTSVASTNSLQSWADVFNAKIPGIDATVASGRIQLVSNRGASNSAGVIITEPETGDIDDTGVELDGTAGNVPGFNLIAQTMFTSAVGLTAAGRRNDYTLNRNTGELKLTAVMEEGSALAAGSIYTRAYIQGDVLSTATATIASGGGKLWFSVDGAASRVTTGVGSSTSFTLTTPGTNQVRYTASPTSTYFTNLSVGDWVVIWDEEFSVHGAWRVSAVDTSAYTYFDVERTAVGLDTGVSPISNGMVFVSSTTPLQLVRVAAGTSRSLTSIVTEMNTQLLGATASIYRNKQIRVTTNTFAEDGNVFLATADTEGQNLLLPDGELVENNASHLAAILSGTHEGDVPQVFGIQTVSAIGQAGAFTIPTAFDKSSLVGWLRRVGTVGATAGSISKLLTYSTLNIPDLNVTTYSVATGGLTRSGTTVTATTSVAHQFNVGDLVYVTPVSTSDANYAAGYKIVTAIPASTTFRYTEAGTGVASLQPYTVAADAGTLVSDRAWQAAPYAIGPEDNLTVVLDGDAVNKNYNLPMWRKVKSTGSYNSTALVLVDQDNSNLRLSVAFGATDTNLFRHFALYMHARGKSHAGTSSNKAVLWRSVRMGPEGEYMTVAYTNPTAPSQALAVSTQNTGTSIVQIRLPSDVARTGLSLYDSTRFTAVVTPTTIDTVVFTYSKPIVDLARDAGGTVVTATAAANHGFVAGDIVYITSGSVNFTSGAKTIVSAGAMTFTYVEAGLALAAAVSQSCSSAPADPSFAGVSVGDIVTIGAASSFASANKGSWRVTAKTGTSFTVKMLLGTGAAMATPVTIGSTANLVFFPIKTADALVSTIVTWVNANATSLLTAVAVEDGGGSPGTGTISISTLDEYLAGTTNSTAGSVSSWPFYDGVNYVKSCDLSANPNTFVLKFPVTSDIVSASDFANEEMRLVPVTADALSRFIGSAAISGFYAGSSINTSAQGHSLQLASSTAGSSGSIQVTGGSANSVGAAVVGTGTDLGSYAKVTVLGTQTKGLIGGAPVAIQAVTTAQKNVAFASTSSIAVVAYDTDQWKITISGAGPTFWTAHDNLAVNADVWQIGKMGGFACYTVTGTAVTSASVVGDWVHISLSAASPSNNGTFMVVAISADGKTFWVENPDVIEERVAVVTADGDKLRTYSYDSVMPGDTLTIDSTVLGANNQGVFTVSDAGPTTGIAADEIVVTGEMVAIGATLLSAQGAFFSITEKDPLRLIKKIRTIGQNSSASSFSDVTFTDDILATKMSSANGCVITPLTKLGFTTDLVTGADAYSYNAGLIGEVNRVIYGDPSNPSVYPGVVAAGANVNISGPLVRRLSIGVAIRIRTGATEKDIRDRVKSAIASVVNKTKLGQPVSISAYLAAAQGVSGVVAATPISPTLSAGNDLIAVQANEKARILDVDQDVLVSIVGA